MPEGAPLKKILSIAGSDPSGGAGIQIDLKTFQALGVFGMAIPSALTIQNSRGVSGVASIPPHVLSAQIKELLTDIKPDAIKTGMLCTKKNVEVVSAAIKKFKIKNLVVDPVVRSSSGKFLLEPRAVASLKKHLLPLALVITPNIPEAEVLANMRIKTDEDMDFAAGTLLDMGPSYVLIKGGHLRGGFSTDTLYGGKTVLAFSTIRRKGEFHGTGCVLSSALAVFMAKGFSVEKAVGKAKEFVDNLLRTAKPVGKGKTKYFQF